MPIVQPDITGSTRTLTLTLPSDLALRTRAYAEMAKASIDSVVRVALSRLLDEDKSELDAYITQNPKALDGRKLAKPRSGNGSPKKPDPSATT